MQEAKLEFVCDRGRCCPFSILCKTFPLFSLIYPEILMIKARRLDMLHTMFEVQSIHLQAVLWMGMSLSQIKKKKKKNLLLRVASSLPPSRIKGPRCVSFFPSSMCGTRVFFFLLLLFFFFLPEQDNFFPFPCGSSYFFPLPCVGQVFF